MTEELKYKVGDKVLIELEVIETKEGDQFPYRVRRLNGDTDGVWSKNKLESIAIQLPPKPKVTQAMMDWYENCEDTYPYIADYFDYASMDVKQWLSEDVRNEHALATLIAYGKEAVEVEKEKKYQVKVKRISQILAKQGDSLIFTLPNPFDEEDEKYLLTKQELIEAGFGDVFDNPMFEVEEVG